MMTKKDVPAMCNERPCQAGSSNHEITVTIDPMIGADSPQNKPNAAPRLFHVEMLPCPL